MVRLNGMAEARDWYWKLFQYKRNKIIRLTRKMMNSEVRRHTTNRRNMQGGSLCTTRVIVTRRSVNFYKIWVAKPEIKTNVITIEVGYILVVHFKISLYIFNFYL